MYTINSKYTKNQHIEKGLTTTIIMPSTKSTTRSSTSKHQQLTVRTSHKKDATAVAMKDDTNSTTPTGTGSSTTTFSNRVTRSNLSRQQVSVSVPVPSKNNRTGSSHRNDAVSTSTNATVTNSTATNITTNTTKPPSSLPTLSSKGMIRQWLNEIELDADLDVVCDAFENAGIDTPHALISLDPSYHYDALHITSSNDKRKLFFLIQRIKHLLVQQEQAQAQEQVVTDESQGNEHEGEEGIVAVAGDVVRTTGAVTAKGNNRNKNDTTGNRLPISKQSLSKQLSSKSMNVLKENFYPSSTSISTLGITTGSVPGTGTTVSKFNDVTTTTTTTATNAQPQQRKLMKSASQLLEDVLNDSASTTATTSKIKSGTPNVSTTTTTSKSPRGNYSRGSVTPKNSSSHTIFFINSYSISLSAILVTFTHTYIIHQSKREIWMFAADDGQRFYLFE
jgi:hypothetical protein